MRDQTTFLLASEIASPEERRAFLDVACADDGALRSSVESLLRHHALSEGFLESPPSELLQTIAAANCDTVPDGVDGPDLKFLAPCATTGCLGRMGLYEVQRVVGRGGMGMVLRARDPKLDRVVALKVILPSLAASAAAVSRFLKEARAVAAVRNDHVVAIHSIHDEGPTPYLVMEFVEGETLQQKIDRVGPLPIDEAARIGREIALGLAAAHRQGLVHSDIKPSNILLDSETGRARITDFGLAYLANDSGETLTGHLAGTPAFMSPEQAQGKRGDQRSDLFSLGGVLYAMCTGRQPFCGATPLATLRSVCEDAPVPAGELNPAVPPWIERILDRLLEKNADARIGSATELVQLLNLNRDAIDLHRITATDSPPRTPPWAGWNSVLGLAAAVLVLVAGVVFVVTRHGKATRFEAPDGSTITTNAKGEVQITLPDSIGKREPRLQPVPLAPAPTDDVDAANWEQTFASLPAAEQIQAVTERLKQLNPDFVGESKGSTEDGLVVGFEFPSEGVVSLAPVRALRHLKSLNCSGAGPDQRSELVDLSPLAGLRLTTFTGNFTIIEDLAPLQGMPLAELSCAFTKIRDLAPLKGMPLRHLSVHESRVRDLSPLRGMPLMTLNCSSTEITDFSPLADSRLRSIFFDNTKVNDLTPLARLPLEVVHWRGCDQLNPTHRRVIQGIPTLIEIDNQTPDEFWRMTSPR